MRCACARGRPSDCQPRPHSQQQTLQLISQHFRSQQLYSIVTTTPRDAFQCISQPNTALLDCILYPTYDLRSRHFTGLCKSVHPCGRVSEIQSIKKIICPTTSPPPQPHPSLRPNQRVYVVLHDPGCSDHSCTEPHFAHHGPKNFSCGAT